MTLAADLEQNPPDKPSRSQYGFSIIPSSKRITAVFKGETIADSTHAIVLSETRLPPVYYFPRNDVRMDLLKRTSHRTHCPFKGNATYWTVGVGEQVVENAVWSYEHPTQDAEGIKEYLAITWSSMDAWYEDGERIYEQTIDSSVYNVNPFTGWLINDAWRTNSSQELVGEFAEVMVRNGVPLDRFRLLIRTLHPQLFAMAYTWLADTQEVEKIRLSHEVLEKREYLESPFAPILEGAGGVRRKLEGPNPLLDYPILKDLHEEGYTDYVAMPMLFSDGQINIFTLVSKQPGGFSTDDLGHLYEMLPAMSRLFEVHAQRRTAITLLNTYLGQHTGKRVLDGVIKRGDGESLNAVIWYCDLRDSTTLTETMDREAYLSYLNQFFDCMAGAVLDHEGEVLKYIGDAVLAIFPVADCSNSEACEHAVAAARDAQRRIETINRENIDRDIPAIKFGLAMHLGHLTYGNIGTTGRLDFTVIGAAVNEAARIEGESKKLGESILISAEFAKDFSGELKSLGTHSLRGVSVAQEIFTLYPEHLPDPGK